MSTLLKFSVPPHRTLLRQAGFTLIDGLVALGILGLGALVAAGMQDIAMSRSRSANDLTAATGLAAEILERITYNRVNVASYGGIDTLDLNTRPAVTQLMARGDYDQWSSRLAATGLTNVRGTLARTTFGPAVLNQNLVTVSVGWGDPLRRHSISVSTLIAPE